MCSKKLCSLHMNVAFTKEVVLCGGGTQMFCTLHLAFDPMDASIKNSLGGAVLYPISVSHSSSVELVHNKPGDVVVYFTLLSPL